MNLKQSDMAIFEKRSAIYVLLAISEQPGATKKSIINSGEKENDRTKFDRINEMIELGLVVYRKEEDDPHNSGSLYLTEEGKEVAAHLAKIRNILKKIEKSKKEQEIAE